MKLAIGIPTYMESDNIAKLVSHIDDAASELKQDILIVNSDNKSSDGTSSLFWATETSNQKIPLVTERKGKGYNIKRILEYVVDNGIDYCVFIDGDIRSFDKSWLIAHFDCAKKQLDFVAPNYKRKFIEGNTTNHFAYPLINYFSNGHSPRQPLAGDFGISLNFAKYLLSMDWPEAAYRYGVDIFITMYALSGDFRCREIIVDSKVHNPSFHKIESMFADVASTYYELRSKIQYPHKSSRSNYMGAPDNLLDSKRPDPRAIRKLKRAALEKVGRTNSAYRDAAYGTGVGREIWSIILAEHEKKIGRQSPSAIAKSLSPFFILRTVKYLEEMKTPEEAVKELIAEHKLIYRDLEKI